MSLKPLGLSGICRMDLEIFCVRKHFETDFKKNPGSKKEFHNILNSTPLESLESYYCTGMKAIVSEMFCNINCQSRRFMRFASISPLKQ